MRLAGLRPLGAELEASGLQAGGAGVELPERHYRGNRPVRDVVIARAGPPSDIRV